MKRILLITMISLFLLGCGAAAKESGFYDHKSVYASWDHFVYSLQGHKTCSEQSVEESKKDGWWGIPQVYSSACIAKEQREERLEETASSPSQMPLGGVGR